MLTMPKNVPWPTFGTRPAAAYNNSKAGVATRAFAAPRPKTSDKKAYNAPSSAPVERQQL